MSKSRRQAKKYLKPTASRSNSSTLGTFGGGPITQGGLYNLKTGTGTQLDHSSSSFFRPTRIYYRNQLEVIRVESWAARKFIELPVDDMFTKWRKFRGPNARAYEMAERRHSIRDRLSRAMKVARLYGSGILVFILADNMPSEPLDIDRIRPGDLLDIQVYDRYETTVRDRVHDFGSGMFNRADTYNITPRAGGSFVVHRSRTIRFDGISSLTEGGFIQYDIDWGVSELIPVIETIVNDHAVASAVSHLVQETSFPVLKIPDLRESLAGELPEAGEPTIHDIARLFNDSKSVYRTVLLDSEDDLSRLGVDLAGIPELMDRYHERVAAAADIPVSRFLGTSPRGLNATGNYEITVYAQTVAANQQKKIAPALDILDPILARDGGIPGESEYEFLPLLDMSESEQADLQDRKLNTIVNALDKGLISREEARERLGEMPLFTNIEGEIPNE